eukprot:SAG31_NODE_29040_length_401_cov_2.056291_1_plen_84_part_01
MVAPTVHRESITQKHNARSTFAVGIHISARTLNNFHQHEDKGLSVLPGCRMGWRHWNQWNGVSKSLLNLARFIIKLLAPRQALF